MKKAFFLIIYCILTLPSLAQPDSLSGGELPAVITVSGFVDVYYAYDFNRPPTT